MRREPIGVCAQITPWNHPMVMAVWKFAPAIAAGDSVVLQRVDQYPLPFVSEMPHGGYGHSGYGKDLSMYGFEEYTRIKHVMSFNG